MCLLEWDQNYNVTTYMYCTGVASTFCWLGQRLPQRRLVLAWRPSYLSACEPTCLWTRTQTGHVGRCYTYVTHALSLYAMWLVHDALWFVYAVRKFKLPYMAVFRTTVLVHFIFRYYCYVYITCTLLPLYALLTVYIKSSTSFFILCVLQCNDLYQYLLKPYSNMRMREALSALLVSLVKL